MPIFIKKKKIQFEKFQICYIIFYSTNRLDFLSYFNESEKKSIGFFYFGKRENQNIHLKWKLPSPSWFSKIKSSIFFTRIRGHMRQTFVKTCNNITDLPIRVMYSRTSAGYLSTSWGLWRVRTKSVFARFNISWKVKVIPHGRVKVKYVDISLPKRFRWWPKILMNPTPSCTSSNCRSTTKCHGNALQKLATPIRRSVASVDNGRNREVSRLSSISGTTKCSL